MNEPIPHHEFLDQVRAAPPDPDIPPEEYARMKRHILDTEYTGLEVVGSYVTADGDTVDCVRAAPAAAAPGPTPPAFQRLPGSPAPPAAAAAGQGESRCPPGTYPKLRVDMARLKRAGSVANFMGKSPGGGAPPPGPG